MTIFSRRNFNSRLVGKALARRVNGVYFNAFEATANEKKRFSSYSVEAKLVHCEWYSCCIWQRNGNLWMMLWIPFCKRTSYTPLLISKIFNLTRIKISSVPWNYEELIRIICNRIWMNIIVTATIWSYVFKWLFVFI